jgi:hypothetical protein
MADAANTISLCHEDLTYREQEAVPGRWRILTDACGRARIVRVEEDDCGGWTYWHCCREFDGDNLLDLEEPEIRIDDDD